MFRGLQSLTAGNRMRYNDSKRAQFAVNMKYYITEGSTTMQYGYFDEKAKEYVITRPDTPRPWANYLGSFAGVRCDHQQ